jgi:predicted transcriptional regulator
MDSRVKMSAQNSLFKIFNQSFEQPKDLICCAFGLKNTELKVYFSLLAGPKSVKQIASEVDKDRTVVQRVLKKLKNKKLITRKRVQSERHLETGGFLYHYEVISSEKVRRQILEQLDDWYKATRRFLLESWPDSDSESE